MIPGGVPCLWALPACVRRPLMDESTFIDNFSDFMPRQTYLCYEVEVSEGDSWTPVEEFKGFLRNQVADLSRQGLPTLGRSGRFSGQGVL